MSRFLLAMTLSLIVFAPRLANGDYLYTVTDPSQGALKFTFTETALLQSGSTTSFSSVTGVPSYLTIGDFVWNFSSSGTCTYNFIPGNFAIGCAGYDLVDKINPSNVVGYSIATGLPVTWTGVGTYHLGLITVTVSGSSSVPEPSTFILLGTGGWGVLGAFRRRSRKPPLSYD